MPSKSSRSSEKGCVGFAYGGIMKDVRIRAFSTEDSDPTKVATEFQSHYGDVNIWYVPVKEVESTFEKYLEVLAETKSRFDNTNLFKLTLSEGKKFLLEVSDAKNCSSFSLKKKEAKNKKKDDESDNDDKDQSDDEDEKQEKQDDKPTKKEKKSKGKKDDSDGTEENDKKPTKKKSNKKKQESEDEKSESDDDKSGSDNDKSESEDEGPKLESKKKDKAGDKGGDKSKQTKAKSTKSKSK
jgi:hypothetical protein